MKNIIASLCVAATIFLVWGFVLPDYQAIGPIKELTAQRQEVLQRRQEIALKIRELASTYESRKADFEELSMVIPPRKEIPEMITAIETIAASNGVQLLSVNLSEQQQSGLPYDVLGIKLALSGNYSALINMLTAVQKNIRLIDIENISISPEVEGLTIKTLSFSLDGKAYFLSDERIAELIKARASEQSSGQTTE